MKPLIELLITVPLAAIGIIIMLWPLWITLAAFKLLGWF